MHEHAINVYLFVFAVSRDSSQFAKRQSALWVVVGVEPPCARRWAGRTVVRDSTAPSVVNSVRVSFNVCDCPGSNLLDHIALVIQHHYNVLKCFTPCDRIFTFLCLSAVATLPADQGCGGASGR